MKKSRLLVAVCVCMLVAPFNTLATTLTFDDITTFTGSSLTDPSEPMYQLLTNTNYGGFAWAQFFLMWYLFLDEEHPVSGYENGLVSGEYIAWKNDNIPSVITRSELFNFNSVYLTAAWNNDLNITVEGYVGGVTGTQLYTQTVVVDTTGPTLFDFNYDGIDTVRFVSFGGTNAGLGGGGVQFAMDDFAFSVIPIPPALLLFCSGLLGLVGFAKKKVL